MSKDLILVDSVNQMKLLRRELKDLCGSVELNNLGNAVKAKAFWNIQRNRLYEAKGYPNMKAFCEGEKFGYSERQIRRLVSQGDEIAAASFTARTPEGERYLTGKHVKDFVDARLRLRVEAGNAGMLLLPESIDEASAVIDQHDDVKAIAREIAKGRARKAAEARDAEPPAEARDAEPPAEARDAEPPADNRRHTPAQVANIKKFVKKYPVSPAIKTRRAFVAVVFGGDAVKMLADFDALDELEQEGVADHAINSILGLR